MNPQEQFEAQCEDANAYADSPRFPADQIAEELKHFQGSGHLYSQTIMRSAILYTDGIKFLAETAQAYWLIDVIHSYQSKADRLCDGFQIWNIRVNEDRTAVIECRSDSDQDPVITQRLEYTDFPLKELKLYVAANTIMLPSEY